ncbi:MAG: VirD4-like conjugal transfer protein, CD1115 family [Eggerthellaceae bacterium]
MKKKKPDMLTILLYVIIVFAVLYVSAGLGAAMDLSVDDEGVLDFNVLMTQFETVLTSTDTVGAHFTDFSSYSFKITLMVGFALGIYALMKYTSRKRLHRKGVEHGSARWANEKEEKFLADRMSAGSKPKRGKDAAQQSLRTATKPEKKKVKKSPKSPFETDNNILLTQEVRMSLNTRQHRENLNVLVIGGSGSGKSRFYVKPNIMQLNTSYVVTDPKGELLRSCGRLLKKAGYEIRVFNLIDMSHSNNYNPFNYIYDKDGNISKTYVMKMVNCLMKNTKQEGASGGDQFWDDSTKALTLAIAFYLLEKKTDENGNSLDRNFSTVMKMMRLAEISEQDENHRSPLDEMMDELRTENPHSMAVSFYADFKKAPAETAKSILISAAVRFAAFNLPEVADLTHTDNIHLDTLGDRKTALFIIIPSSDATFNFLAAMMYTQLFDTLYDTANFKYGGKLPVHVRCLLDEFANVGTIPDFDKLLATMRSMEISANIIIQNLAQLKKMYDKSWEILTGNCDSLLFLGGQEATTLEAISKSLGKETIDVVSQNRTRSHKSPSTSENNSILGRELMTTDELKVMKPNECVLIVRALYPFFCHKFDIEKHQNYKYLEDSNKNYAYLIDDLHTEKAPDITEIYSETVEPKTVAQPVDDEKDISDIDVPDEEDNMTNLDEEFDTKEIAAALKQHEEQTAGEEMFNENEELDFSDEAVPENIMPMDLSIPKVIGEADFNEIVDSTF